MDTAYNILVADDHPIFREALTNVIAHGFVDSQVFETENLESTLALARENEE